MSSKLWNSIDLVQLKPLSSQHFKSAELSKSNASNESIGQTVNPHELHKLVVKGVTELSKRLHYMIGDKDCSKSCGPVLQVIPRDSEVIVRQETTRCFSKQNSFDGKNLIDENEIGIKIGPKETDFLILLGKNGCVLVESGAFVNIGNDSSKESVFIIKKDGKFAQLTEDKQIVRLFKGGHLVLVGIKTIVIIVGSSGYDEEKLMTNDFISPEESLTKPDSVIKESPKESKIEKKLTKDPFHQKSKSEELLIESKENSVKEVKENPLEEKESKIEELKVDHKISEAKAPKTEDKLSIDPLPKKSKSEELLIESKEKSVKEVKENPLEEKAPKVDHKISEAKESLIMDRNQKSNETQKFAELLPKSTFEDLNRLSTDHKFIQLVHSLPPNTWYFSGNFGANQFICKIYNKHLLAPLHRKQYLNEELTIADQLVKGIFKHQNLVKMLKVILYDHNVFLFMDYCEKTALEVILKNGPQDENFAKRFIHQMLRAVDYLHSNGFAHRDIKLENIYICGEKHNLNAKLSEFKSVVKCLSGEKIIRDKTWVGTEEYLSPETLERVLHDPQKSDIWSLGVCLFLVVYNCFPFRSGEDIRSDRGRDIMLNNQLVRKYLIPPSIQLSLNCLQMYRLLMTPEYSSRPTAKQALKHSFVKELV